MNVMAPVLLRRLPLLRFMASRNFFTPSSFRLHSYPHSSSSLPLSTLSKPRYIIFNLFLSPWLNATPFEKFSVFNKRVNFFYWKICFLCCCCCWGYSLCAELMVGTKGVVYLFLLMNVFDEFVWFSQEENFS